MTRSPRDRNARRMTEMSLSLGISRVSRETALKPGVSGEGSPGPTLWSSQVVRQAVGRPSGGVGWEESSG